MKKYMKLLLCFSLLLCMLLPYSYAANKDKAFSSKASKSANVEQMKKNIKQKLNIINKNNIEIKKLQNQIKLSKNLIMNKINNLRKNKNITQAELLSLKSKVEILKNYTSNLASSNTNIEKAAKNINKAKLSNNFYGVMSDYDLIIEKQNEKIITLKDIIKNINEIK